MSEPKRLIEGDGMGRHLVASMQRETLSADARLRMRAALGLGAGVTTAATMSAAGAAKTLTTAAAPTSVALGAVKWVGILAISSATVGGGWMAWRTPSGGTSSTGPATSTAAAGGTAATPTLRSQASGEPRAAEAIPTRTLADGKATETAPPASASSSPHATAKTSATGPVSTLDVTEELRLLEMTRSRLRVGDAAGALSSLERYRQRAPNGALRVEADVLEVEALVALGRRDEAVKKGRAILARHPEGPLSGRVRRLLAE